MRRLKITQKNNNFLKPGSIHYVWFGDNIFCHITKFVIFGLLFWLLLYVAKILPFPVHVGSMSLIVLFWISLICLIFIKLCYRVVKKLWQYVKHGATAAGFCNLRTANWRTGNMRTNMRTRPLIGRDVTRVPRAVRKVPHGVRSSHCFVSRPNEPYCSIAERRCICIFMTTVFWQLFVSVTEDLTVWIGFLQASPLVTVNGFEMRSVNS